MNPQRNPPVEWVTERPQWCLPGRKLKVVTDKTSPEYGRAAGFLSPSEGSVVYANDLSGRRRAPKLGPSGGQWFHAGEWDYTQPDGQLVSIKVGSIAVSGGHSDSVPGLVQAPYTTDKMGEARNYLQRAGRWQDQHGDLVLHGRVQEVKGEGILFLGAAYEWADERDLDVINATTVSPEFWGNPDFGGREDFLGAARILRTALPGPDYVEMPIAASLDPDEHVVVSFGQPAFTSDDVNEVTPILAEITQGTIDGLQSAIDALQSTLDSHVERMDRLEAALFEQAASAMDHDDLALPDQVTSIAAEVRRLAELVEQHHRNDNRPTPDVVDVNGAAPTP